MISRLVQGALHLVPPKVPPVKMFFWFSFFCSARDGPNMFPRCPNMSPRGSEDVSSMAQLVAKMDTTWSQHGPSCGPQKVLPNICSPHDLVQATRSISMTQGIRSSLGPPWGHLGSRRGDAGSSQDLSRTVLGASWTFFGVSWAICLIWGPSWAFLCPLRVVAARV